jgi:hypothetical protein
MVPILILGYQHLGFSPSILTHLAIGTSLFVVLFTSLSSSYQQSKQNNIDWRAVLVIGLSSALTGFGTAHVAAALSGRHLRVSFAIIVMAAAIRMLTESEKKAQQKFELLSRSSTIGLVGVGLLAGVVSALAGIGGGVFTVPMMYYFLRMPLKLAIGTSSAAIFITALFSVIGFIINGMGRPGLPEWSVGFVDLQRGVALSIGTFLLARVGAYLSFKTHPYRLRKLFALFVMLVAIFLLVK